MPLGRHINSREQARAVRDTRTIPTAVASLSGLGNAGDLVVLLEQQVQVFHNAVEATAPPAEDRFLASLDYARNRDNYEIDVRRIIDEFEIEQNSELNAVQGREPDQQLTLEQAIRNGEVVPVSLNGDARDELFVFLQRSREEITGTLLLSEP